MAYLSRPDVLGAELTSLQVGGPCRRVLETSNEPDLLLALAEHPEAVCIGGGSNLLISDNGFDGELIRAWSSTAGGIHLANDTGAVHVESTVDWDALVRFTIEAGLQGLEATSGIPGSVGGAIVQNAGAYGQEIGDAIVRVRAWDRENSATVSFDQQDCGFAYRTSRFKHDSSRRFIITSAELRLSQINSAKPRYGDVSQLLAERRGNEGPHPLADIRKAVLDVRAGKGMLLGASLPSAGSFFTNPVISEAQTAALESAGVRVIRRSDGVTLASAATLMEATGFHRGNRHGRVGLSELHVLALVNLGGATTIDVIAFAQHIRNTVHDRLGIWLTPEPVLLGFDEYPFV